MTVRRLAVATAVALGLLASGAQAGGTVALDGARRNRAQFSGSLTEPALRPDRLPTTVDPERADCTASSCDQTALRLSVPPGSTAGRFAVDVVADRSLNVAVFLYDSRGEVAGSVDLLETRGSVECCANAPDTRYRRGFVRPRLGPGRYTLVVYNRGGAGEFTADVEYRAHPQDRPRKK